MENKKSRNQSVSDSDSINTAVTEPQDEWDKVRRDYLARDAGKGRPAEGLQSGGYRVSYIREGAKSGRSVSTLVIIAVLIAVIAAGVGVFRFMGSSSQKSDYDKAVSLVSEGDYDQAKYILADLEYKDSEALYNYSDLQSRIGEYKGKAAGFAAELAAIKDIENEGITEQYEKAEEQAELAVGIQKDIDDLEVSAYDTMLVARIESIKQSVSKLDPRYTVLLDTGNYDFGADVVGSVHSQDGAGQVITGIDNIGEVTLKSKSMLKSLREQYDGLSDADKEKVINYDKLVAAEEQYKALEEKERLKKQKEAEEKAAAETAAAEARAEEAEKRAEEAEKKARKAKAK